MKQGGLHSRFINERLNSYEDELHSESTFTIAQSATESLKRLDDWEYEDSITLMFTAETDEGRKGEEKKDISILGCLITCVV